MGTLPLRSWSMARSLELPSSRTSEATVVARYGVLKCFLVSGFAACVLAASGCFLSFDHYAEGDVCDAGRDAGVRLSSAPDPVLRGCDAGPEPEPETSSGAAGTAGAEDRP
jgi:hypothetical protein